MTPEAVAAEVERGHACWAGAAAGFPAGRKWSMLAKAAPLTYHW